MTADDQDAPEPDGADALEGPRSAPVPLVVAGIVSGLQGLVLLVLGVVEVVTFSTDRAVMGATVAVFFIVFGLLLLLAAYSLTRTLSWGRGLVLITEVIALCLAWSFRSGGTWWVAGALVVSAVVVLLGLLNRGSIEALDR